MEAYNRVKKDKSDEDIQENEVRRGQRVQGCWPAAGADWCGVLRWLTHQGPTCVPLHVTVDAAC